MIDVLLLLAPALVLLCALLAGAYPGERRIASLAARRPPPRRRQHRALGTCRPRPAPQLPRGGRLVAAAIAARPPPRGWRCATTSIHVSS
jgi:hypothetical protein